MRGKPAAAEAGMMLQPSGVRCILPGNLPLHHGTLAVVGCTGSQGRVGVWIVTCACTQDFWWLQEQR